MASECIRCIVSGTVQGVFFRATTRERARELGLRGYARNLPDGRVEVVACGEPGALERLEDWLWEGPAHASVAGVESESVEDPGVKGFGVR
ncbi:MAG: acylphosphatase [Ectothiorhodospiraceae bacterium]|jgi:acylphosphatase